MKSIPRSSRSSDLEYVASRNTEQKWSHWFCEFHGEWSIQEQQHKNSKQETAVVPNEAT